MRFILSSGHIFVRCFKRALEINSSNTNLWGEVMIGIVCCMSSKTSSRCCIIKESCHEFQLIFFFFSMARFLTVYIRMRQDS